MNDIRQQLVALDPEIIRMLQEDLSAQLADVRSAIEQGDAVRARDIVHVINGSASFCRLESLRSHATALENRLDENNIDAVLVDAFEKCVTETLHALENLDSPEEPATGARHD